MTLNLLVGNDNLIEVEGLQSELDLSNYLNAATVKATLKDLEGVDVAGAIDIVLSYVSASNGNYNGTLDDTVVLSENTEYELWVDGNAGAGLQALWKIPVRTVKRTA